MFQTLPIPIAALLALAIVTPARAELLVYEPFDYVAGANVDGLSAGGTNLTGNYAALPTRDLVIASPGLTYGSLPGPAVVGNRLNDVDGVVSGRVSVALAEDIVIGAGDEIFFSALFTFDDSTNGNRFARVTFVDGDNGGEMTFGEASVGVRAVGVTAATATTGGLIADRADQSFIDGQTLWLIGRYFNSAASMGDELQLVGYDTAVAQSIAPSFDLSDPNAEFNFSLTGRDIDFGKISLIGFEVRGDNNNSIDELRIGQTYTDVTAATVAAIPEPATGVMLPALMLLGSLGTRLRRAKLYKRSQAATA